LGGAAQEGWALLVDQRMLTLYQEKIYEHGDVREYRNLRAGWWRTRLEGAWAAKLNFAWDVRHWHMASSDVTLTIRLLDDHKMSLVKKFMPYWLQGLREKAL
jgi:hypothetical protein